MNMHEHTLANITLLIQALTRLFIQFTCTLLSLMCCLPSNC